MKYTVIGCGGIGGWLTRLVSYTLGEGDALFLTDGDTIELRNLDRQLFGVEDVGKNKAEAMGTQLVLLAAHRGFAIASHPAYLTRGVADFKTDILLCCADNNAARVTCLEYVDQGQAKWAVIGGNETESAEAYVYFPQFRDHPILDPRKRFGISDDHTHDPTAPCTGEAADTTPQLPTANAAAAVAMAQLLHYWKTHDPEADNANLMPCRHCTSGAFWQSERIG